MSASSRPVETPLAARPRARFTAVVDLPTPPLPEATAMMCFTPGTSMRPPPPVVLAAGAPWACPWECARGAGAAGAGRSEVITAVADSTPGIARTACSQAWRRGSRPVPGAGSPARVTATWPPRTAMPPTMPCATTLFAVAGSMTASRAWRPADSVISAISACFRGLAILCRRLIAGVAAVTYMQRDLKSKQTMRRARWPVALRGTMGWKTNSGGPWGGGGGGNSGGPWGGGGGNRGGGGGPFGSRRPPDMEDVIRKGQERLKNLIPGGFGSYKGIVLVVLLGLVIWLVTGFFRVQPNQQAIQLVFGKPYGKPGAPRPHLGFGKPYAKPVEPGLHYNLPSPIGNVVVVNVQDQRRVVIGSRGGQDGPPTHTPGGPAAAPAR